MKKLLTANDVLPSLITFAKEMFGLKYRGTDEQITEAQRVWQEQAEAKARAEWYPGKWEGSQAQFQDMFS